MVKYPKGMTLKYTWEINVKNCDIDESLSIPITGDIYDYPFEIAEFMYQIGKLRIKRSDCFMSHCGRWYWITFKTPELKTWFALNYDKEENGNI